MNNLPKPKLVNWGLIEYDDELYEFVNNIIKKYHGGENGIENVSIVLMWKYNSKPDQDGYIVLANITKSSDQVRELRPHEFILGINKDAWSFLDDQQKTVVIDSQLERIATCFDKKGNIKEDDRSRIIYRLKKPQVVDEQILQRRHGLTLQEVQEVAFNQLARAGSEKGSYVDKVLSDTSEETEEVTTEAEANG